MSRWFFVPWVLLYLAICADPARAAADGEACVPQLRAVLNVDPRGTPVVELALNGGTAHLLLDTGAERTILTEDAARRLGVLAGADHPQLVRGIGGNVVGSVVKAGPQGVGGQQAAGLTFIVVPVQLPKVGDLVVDGLFGADMLRAYDLDLDIGHHLILLYDPPACGEPVLPWGRAYDTVDAKLSRHGHMAFPVTLDGHRLTAFIDTGSQVSLVDAGTTSRIGVSAAALDEDDAVEMEGVSTQPVTAREHQFRALGMADALLMAPTVGVTPLGLDDADMLMGTDMLGRERIWLSYSARRIYVARPE